MPVHINQNNPLRDQLVEGLIVVLEVYGPDRCQLRIAGTWEPLASGSEPELKTWAYSRGLLIMDKSSPFPG